MVKKDDSVKLVDYCVEYDVLVQKINKYYLKLKSDYKFYKELYLESIEKDRINNRHEATMKTYSKQLENLEYYFHDVLSSVNTDTEIEIKDDEMPF